MLTKYELKMPHAVYSGEDALGRIPEIFATNGVKRLVVFTDKGIEGAGLLEFPMAKVRETGVETVILDDLPAEPSYIEAQKLVDQCKQCGADFIMAVGGGSVMDTAKLASILMTDEYGIKELLDEPGRAKKCMKTLMIPTTAGTGSEATPNAIVAVPEKQLKVGIVNTEMIADYVILDAVMIKKLPRKIAAATGVDALAHAIECFTSNKAKRFWKRPSSLSVKKGNTTMKRMLSLLTALAMALALAACGGNSGDSSNGGGSSSGGGASGWPEKTINIYVTHAAGGDTDYMARQLGEALQKELGQSVVCTNVTGSNGATCMQQYKDGDTDGYTFIASNTAALNGNEATSMVDFGYDAFEPVAIYGIQSGENIVVPADAPYDDLEGFIEASKANPGQIKYGTSTGGGVYIQTCVLTNLGGAQFNIIDAGDAANRLTALLGGEVDGTSLPYSTAADYIENGQLKSLCTCLSKAPAMMPDQKSASETIPELIVDTEYVLLAPKGTPAELVEAMNAAILKVTGTDEWKTMVNEYCYQDPFVLNVADSTANLKEQRDLFQSFVPFL